GVVNDLNSVFFIEITGVSSELASIRNLQLGKKQVRQIATTVEIAGIYPVIKPRHVKKWRIKGYYFMIVPHAKHGQNNEMELREKMPKTYEYLEIFKADLEGRASKWFKGEGMPFYSLFGIGEYTFQPFKVVWSSIGALHAFAVASSIHDPRIGTRLVIPDNTIGYLSFDTSDEAHYACAILNASAIKEMFAAHSTGSKWGISIAMVNDLPIPRFDPDNPVHVRLCRLSKEAHDRTAKNESIAELERELDVLVSGLFSTIQREK
nr:hypothetical protein [Candidatus Sigynarchaeota archaeon]